MYKKVDVGKKILSANEEYALKNSRLLAEHKIFCLNMISSPGSGKTTILTRTINELKDKIKIGVVEGDIQTDLDAERIRATSAPVVQINTNGACHLSAAQVGGALENLPVSGTINDLQAKKVLNSSCWERFCPVLAKQPSKTMSILLPAIPRPLKLVQLIKFL